MWGVSDWGWAPGEGQWACLPTCLASSLRPECLLGATALSGAGTKVATRGSRGSQPRAALPQCRKPREPSAPVPFPPRIWKAGWAGGSVAADWTGRGGRSLKEPPSLSDIRVCPHQSASLLDRKSAVTFWAAHSQLQGDLFPQPSQRCLSCGSSGHRLFSEEAEREAEECVLFLPPPLPLPAVNCPPPRI